MINRDHEVFGNQQMDREQQDYARKVERDNKAEKDRREREIKERKKKEREEREKNK